ncbi:MAG: patatin-like phospholipase family protein [Chloroflexota bacterium]|nr:patatin-like phospholipase family protein [Chloroflexota bacterium]
MCKIPKVGLTLSGGAARGLAHIGVLQALEEENIPVDMIAGTSIGAIIGACYAKDRQMAPLKKIATEIHWRDMAHWAQISLLLARKGLIQGGKIKDFLTSIIGNIQFDELQIPLSVVATDVHTMEEVIIQQGSVIEAIMASSSFPVILTPVRRGKSFLTDGGIVNPMPVNVTRSMGAEIIIAVNVIPLTQQEGDEDKQKPKSKSHAKRNIVAPEAPNIIHVLMQSIHAMQYELIRLAADTADITINPDVSHIGPLAFHKGEESIYEGYQAAREVVPQIQQLLHCPPSSPMVGLPDHHAKHR